MSDRDEAITNSINASIENMNSYWRDTYLVLCKTLLSRQLYVAGEDLSAYCRWRGLEEPDTHNRWVGGVAMLLNKNMMEPVLLQHKDETLRIRPSRPTNHMNNVGMYRSLIYDEPTLWKTNWR